MAFYKRIDFAGMCGLTPGNLSNYISRHKVILTDDLIDDSLLINKEFLQKRRQISDLKNAPEPEKEPLSEKKIESNTIKTEKTKRKSTRTKPTEENLSYNRLELLQKEISIEKSRVEIDLKILQKQKLEGYTVPVDLVKTVFIQHTKNITTAFHSGADNFLMEISKKKGLSRSEVAEMRGFLVDMINKSAEKSIIQSKKELSQIVQEFTFERENKESE